MLYGDASHRVRVWCRVRSDRALPASRTLIDAMSRGRATGNVCSMVCGYDKVKVCQNVNRGARNMCASKAEAAMRSTEKTDQGILRLTATADDRQFTCRVIRGRLEFERR